MVVLRVSNLSITPLSVVTSIKLLSAHYTHMAASNKAHCIIQEKTLHKELSFTCYWPHWLLMLKKFLQYYFPEI